MKQTNKKRRLFEDDEILGTTDVLGLSKVPKDAAKAAIGAGTKDGDTKDDIKKVKKQRLKEKLTRLLKPIVAEILNAKVKKK